MPIISFCKEGQQLHRYTIRSPKFPTFFLRSCDFFLRIFLDGLLPRKHGPSRNLILLILCCRNACKRCLNCLKSFRLSNFISRLGARFFRIFPEFSGNTRSKVLSQLSLFRSLQQKLARGGCTSSEYMILAVACANKPSHISVLFVCRTV